MLTRLFIPDERSRGREEIRARYGAQAEPHMPLGRHGRAIVFAARDVALAATSALDQRGF
jgi:hypothetical protein